MLENILVLATKNQGKIREIKELLHDFPIEIKGLDEFGPLPEAVEHGASFDENAYKKAIHYARILGLAAMADDSGLVVDALGGAPGVYSARFGGPGLSDAQRANLLLQKMQGLKNRKAAFECVVSIAVPTGPALTYEGRVEGLITEQPAGENGFGYDPVFFYPPAQKTFAQISAAEKNRVSHRGQAFREIAEEFDKIMGWLRRHM